MLVMDDIDNNTDTFQHEVDTLNNSDFVLSHTIYDVFFDQTIMYLIYFMSLC